MRTIKPPEVPTVSRLAKPSITATTWVPVSYTTSVAGLGAGQTLTLPQIGLQSGFNTPYLIDEIRFTAYTPTTNTGGDNAAIAGILHYQLQAGQFAFCQSSLGSAATVPMCLYAPTYSGGGVFENAGLNTTQTFATRRWVLPKPLWMPPGDLVHGTVTRSDTVGTSIGAITAQMTIIGRALPPDSVPPKARCIPHVGWFIHPAAATYSEATQQLKNPYTSPLHVQRFILNTRCIAVSVIAGANGTQLGNGIFEDPTGVVQYARIRIADSLGYKITGSARGGFMPLADVAAAVNDDAWSFGRPLPPNEYYNVAFQIVPGSGTTFTNFQPLISMVGYREELT